jgi:hypothetical protein
METGTHDPFGGGQTTTGEAKEKARELTRTTRERAMSAVGQGKDQLCGVLERAADSMDDDRFGRYASDYARRGAEFLRRRSPDELLDSARRTLRSRPGVVLSACFVAGLAFARFVKGAASDGDEGRYDGRRFDEGRWREPETGESGRREGSWPTADPGAGWREDRP